MTRPVRRWKQGEIKRLIDNYNPEKDFHGEMQKLSILLSRNVSSVISTLNRVQITGLLIPGVFEEKYGNNPDAPMTWDKRIYENYDGQPKKPLVETGNSDAQILKSVCDNLGKSLHKRLLPLASAERFKILYGIAVLADLEINIDFGGR